MLNNILLTGATGFLGSYILKSLVLNQYNVIILKRSFSNTSRINALLPHVKYYDIDKVPYQDIFSENLIDVIIHMATNYGRKKTNAIDVVSANLLFPLELLSYGAEQGNLKVFINTDTIVDKKMNQYALSKHQFCDWLMFYEKRVKCINVALEHFYGFQDDKTKFISNMIDLILKKVASIDLTIGDQRRDFVYIDDVVSGFMGILQNIDKLPCGYTNFDIGTGRSVAIRHCVEYIKKVAGNNVTKLNFGGLPYREHELMQSNANITKLFSLGWRPRVTFEEGIYTTKFKFHQEACFNV